MKQGVQKLYLILFAVVICVPWAARMLGEHADVPGSENRMSAQKPVLHADTWKEYPSAYEAWFNDTIPFRDELITLHGFVNYRLFHTSVNDSVLLGKGKWLFYKSEQDGNPMGNYEGTNVFGAEETDAIKTAAMHVQDRLEKMGIQTAFVIPPDKERIYSQYMPDCYVLAEQSRTGKLVLELKKAGVHITYPEKELRNAASENQLYYAYDTHWNQLGAYVGTAAVLETYGMQLPALDGLTVLSHPLRDNYHICALDDLANMLNLREAVFWDEMEYVIEENYRTDWQEVTDGLIHVKNRQAPCEKTLLLIGDSFRVSMIPALATCFTDVYAVHRGSYTPDMLNGTKPDYLIAEYVERYSGQLADAERMIFGSNEQE